MSTAAVPNAVVAAEVQPWGTDQLRITASGANQDSGTFARSATEIEFAATATSALRADVTLTVGGKKFVAKKDLSKGVAQWSGGGAALQPDDHDAIVAFAEDLSSTWVSEDNSKAAIPLHRDSILRFALLLAEAPVGVKIGTQDVPRPVERYGKRKLPEGTPAVESCIEASTANASLDSAERGAALAACQESNEDGILYTGCNENAWVVHDADSHCFLGETIYVGPASYDCMGKCGGGCFIITGYTYDCADHDRCGRAHGGSTDPWDSECGDEYWEADDDFLWSTNQCG